MWDLSFLNRDRTRVPCIARHILNHGTTREVCPMRSVKDLFLGGKFVIQEVRYVIS